MTNSNNREDINSGHYSEIDTTKVLKVISAWNTDRKWQSKLKE